MKAIGSNRQFVPLVFSKDKMLDLSGNDLKFLEAWMRLGDMVKAAEEQGIDLVKAKKILNRKKNKVYLEDRMKEIAISKGLSAEWFMSQLLEVWNGTKQATREQMEAIKEIGRRSAPAKSNESSEKVVVNINLEAVKKAIERQEVFEAKDLNANS